MKGFFQAAGAGIRKKVKNGFMDSDLEVKVVRLHENVDKPGVFILIR